MSMPQETLYDAACLLATAARSDGSIATQETESLVAVLQRGFSLKGAAALELVVRAIDAARDLDDLSPLLRNLEHGLKGEQKERLMVMLLEVVAADGVKDAREIGVLDKAIAGLKLTDKSVDRAFRSYFDSRKQASA